MYGKIFESMYDGTLAADWKAMITFQQMIVLADQDGIVDYTPPALSRRTGIPMEIIEHGIQKLEQPDPYSRTEDDEGRRIRRLDDHRPWGWVIINYDHYRQLSSYAEKREQARLRQQKHREKKRQATDSNEASQDVTHGNAPSRMSRHTDTDTNTDKDTSPTVKVPCQAIVDLYHEHCPNLPRVKVLSEKRRRTIRTRWKSFEFMKGVGKPGEPKELIKFNELRSWERYFKFIAFRCSFMAGNNDRNWVANFDFCIRESGMIGVLENKYVDRK